MIVTIESWQEVERDLQTNGVADAEYDETGTVTAIIGRSGMRYEVSRDVILELQRRGMVDLALGRRVDPRAEDVR